MNGYDLIIIKKCPICGRHFVIYGDWAFKTANSHLRSAVYYCSWSCLRANERQIQKERE